MIVTVRPAERADIRPIAAAMREVDRRECAAFGMSPRGALEVSLASSHEAWCGLVDGEPVALFGVSSASLLSGLGRPWMLGTDRVALAARELLTEGPAYVERMRTRFPFLENWVSRDNRRALSLLRRLGFVVEGEARTIGGEEMLRFTMGAADVR